MKFARSAVCAAVMTWTGTSIVASQLIFPGQTVIPEPPECPEGQSYCAGEENDYPSAIVNDAVQRVLAGGPSNPAFDKFFKKSGKTKNEATGNQLLFETGKDIKPACRSRTELIGRFSRARSVVGKWMYLVEGPNGQQQEVEVTICENEGSVCRNDKDSPHGKGSTVCKQLFRTNKLLAVNDGGEVVIDTFELPSACVCNYKENGFGFRRNSPFLPFPSFREVRCNDSEPTEPLQPSLQHLEADLFTPSASGSPTNTKEKRQSLLAVSSDQVSSSLSPVDACIGTLCESVGNISYPESRIRLLMRNTGQLLGSPVQFKKLFGRPCQFEQPLMVFRIGFDVAESPLCSSFEKYIFPKLAQDVHGSWKYVVNTEEYRQGVTVEECMSYAKGSSCKYGGLDGVNPGATECRQIYSRHNLLSLLRPDEIGYATFMVPSACICHLKDPLSFREENQ